MRSKVDVIGVALQTLSSLKGAASPTVPLSFAQSCVCYRSESPAFTAPQRFGFLELAARNLRRWVGTRPNGVTRTSRRCDSSARPLPSPVASPQYHGTDGPQLGASEQQHGLLARPCTRRSPGGRLPGARPLLGPNPVCDMDLPQTDGLIAQRQAPNNHADNAAESCADASGHASEQGGATSQEVLTPPSSGMVRLPAVGDC